MYPLRVINEPGTFVLGERTGQQVYPDASRMPHSNAGGSVPMGMNQQAMLAQQNREMAAYDRRQQQPRDRASGMASRNDEEDSAGLSLYSAAVQIHMAILDELDQVSTQALALARYKRNHEFMNEIFIHAALSEL